MRDGAEAVHDDLGDPLPFPGRRSVEKAHGRLRDRQKSGAELVGCALFGGTLRATTALPGSGGMRRSRRPGAVRFFRVAAAGIARPHIDHPVAWPVPLRFSGWRKGRLGMVPPPPPLWFLFPVPRTPHRCPDVGGARRDRIAGLYGRTTGVGRGLPLYPEKASPLPSAHALWAGLLRAVCWGFSGAARDTCSALPPCSAISGPRSVR